MREFGRKKLGQFTALEILLALFMKVTLHSDKETINRIFMLCNYACRIADALYVVLDRYCSANIAVCTSSAM